MRIGMIGAVRDPLRPGGPSPELSFLLPPGAALRAYPSRVPAFPYTEVERLLQQVGHLDAAISAAADGCAALVIESVGDYGLTAMQAGLSVPVFGAGACGLAAASSLGRRIGIATVWPASMNFILMERLHACGLADACTGIVNVGGEAALDRLAGPDGYLAQVRDGAGGIIADIDGAIASLVANGAQAVLLGCTCMSPLAARLSARAPVPVINPLAEAVRAAVAAGAATPPPQPLTLRPGRRELVARMVDAVADDPAEDCPICVVSSALEDDHG